MKPFLTIEEQVRLLESRGMEIDIDAHSILLREGYYAVVNGYKEPFLDYKKSAEAKDDRYISGTKFSDVYATFLFDRQLREITLKYLIRAEAAIKAAIVYCFSEAHPEPDAIFKQANYCEQHEFRQPKHYAKELIALTTILSERVSHSKSPYVVHYRNTHKAVPLWVLVNDLTFGTIDNFYGLMKPKERERVCKVLAKSLGHIGDSSYGYLSQKEAQIAIEALHKFRNICAHDERLYSTTVGGRKRIGYYQMVKYLRRFLTKEDFGKYQWDFMNALAPYAKRGDFTLEVVDSKEVIRLYKSFQSDDPVKI